MPVRLLLAYIALALAPLVAGLVHLGSLGYGLVAVPVAILSLAAALALVAGSRVAWTILLVIDLGALASALGRTDWLIAALVALRLTLLVSPPIRDYAWNTAT